jgi:hypothetical protein
MRRVDAKHRPTMTTGRLDDVDHDDHHRRQRGNDNDNDDIDDSSRSDNGGSCDGSNS